MFVRYTLAAFVPVLTVFYWTYRYFQYTNRELKRLDSVARSPIYSFFGQCLAGLATIRAFRACDRMAEESAEKVDNQARFMLALVSSNRWLSIRLELLGGVMILVTAVFLVIGANSGAVDPSTAGLSLSCTCVVFARDGPLLIDGKMCDRWLWMCCVLRMIVHLWYLPILFTSKLFM